MTQSRELLRSKEHSLTTSAIVSKWLTFTYCNSCEGDSWSTWKFLKPPFLFQPHPKPPFPVLTSELFSLLLLPFALRFHKLKLQTADKTWTSPFDNLIKAMAFLPEKWSHACACARMCVCAHTRTHTHTHWFHWFSYHFRESADLLNLTNSFWVRTPAIGNLRSLQLLSICQRKRNFPLPMCMGKLQKLSNNRWIPTNQTPCLLLQKLVFLQFPA